jgi:hypothetical protein
MFLALDFILRPFLCVVRPVLGFVAAPSTVALAAAPPIPIPVVAAPSIRVTLIQETPCPGRVARAQLAEDTPGMPVSPGIPLGLMPNPTTQRSVFTLHVE